MQSGRTEKRKQKIISVITARQPSLKIVLENIHDPHNVSAIFRTCDAAGVPKVCLIYNHDTFPKIGKKTSASAFKWVETEKFKEVKECYKKLKEDGFKIFASSISKESKDFYEIDFTGKCAVVFGNEHSGISEEAESLADEKFVIPMYGMVQSLNVSVAAAVVLYEALRQRKAKGMYDKSEMKNSELKELIDKWNKK